MLQHRQSSHLELLRTARNEIQSHQLSIQKLPIVLLASLCVFSFHKLFCFFIDTNMHSLQISNILFDSYRTNIQLLCLIHAELIHSHSLIIEVPRIMRSKALILIMYPSKLHPSRNNGKCTCDALENLRADAYIPLQL